MKKLLFIIVLFISSTFHLFSQNVETQYIGNYIFVLANNVSFPAQNRINTYKIAVYGNNSDVYKYLLKIYKKKKIHDKHVKIYNISKLKNLETHYNIIFLDPSKNRQIENIYKAIKKSGTLLITYKNNNQDYIMINLLGIGKKFQIQTSNLYDEHIIPSENLIAIGGTKIDLQGLYGKKVKKLDEQEHQLEKKQKALDSLKIIINKDKLVNENKSIELQQKELELQKKEEKLKKQEKRLKTQNVEIKIQKNIILIIIIFVIILVILSFVIYRALKINREINVKLRQKNEEIRQQTEKISEQAKQIKQQRDLAIVRGNELEEINKDIKASITYALNIQQALLPDLGPLSKYFDSFFIYYKPRDIVSGDFYWVAEKNNQIYAVAADCTGHGVPGAFMSMLGIAYLNEIVNFRSATDTNIIIEKLRENVISSLKQSTRNITSSKDGMDLAIIRYDKDNMLIEYSGAYNSLYIISGKKPEIIDGFDEYRISESENTGNKLYEIRADRMPIGIYIKQQKAFTSKKIKVQKGDLLYMFSDGFADMYNEENSSKFGTKRFKELLLSISDLPLEEQRNKIEFTQSQWIGKTNQIDDILILGIKI